ncbi:Uncharacterised protein [Vibrio cholerae]|nr:Uncharacterised protein [Vibrio cholerae]
MTHGIRAPLHPPARFLDHFFRNFGLAKNATHHRNGNKPQNLMQQGGWTIPQAVESALKSPF